MHVNLDYFDSKFIVFLEVLIKTCQALEPYRKALVTKIKHLFDKKKDRDVEPVPKLYDLQDSTQTQLKYVVGNLDHES